jgi:hypothetical protein
MSSRHDETGLVGKIIVIWLLVVGLLGVIAIDAASILFARFRLADTATVAAVTAANRYRSTRDQDRACGDARSVVERDAADAVMSRNFCRIDRATGEVTIVLRQEANALVADLLPFTEDFTKIVVKETGRPATL